MAAAMNRELGRSPTFLVESERQRQNLNQLHRKEQHFAESFGKSKPLCFSAGCYQKTHPLKAAPPHIDADATLISPMLLGVCDGVSQIQDPPYNLDPARLPRELLGKCEELACQQLVPNKSGRMPGTYEGPIPLMKNAFEETESLGSTTALLALLDNGTQMHGKLHPMIAVLSVGDCQMVILRQKRGRGFPYEVSFHTEMQRIDGHAQCPLQICRLNESYDPNFDDRIPLEVIERGSAQHCVSVYEGDLVILGSDGVFDNLFVDEILAICNHALCPRSAKVDPVFRPRTEDELNAVAKTIVAECHAKTRVGPQGQFPNTPIGKGGKQDDTCCVVGEVIEWTERLSSKWQELQRERRAKQWVDVVSDWFCCLKKGPECVVEEAREYSHSFPEEDEEDDGQGCCA
jgi:serine/threonine protein phosphatase PrpC